jgi:hypothetical protein
MDFRFNLRNKLYVHELLAPFLAIEIFMSPGKLLSLPKSTRAGGEMQMAQKNSGGVAVELNSTQG